MAVKVHLLKESNNKLSINLPVNRGKITDDNLRNILKANFVTHKLVLADCKEIAKEHLVVRYDFTEEVFEVLAIHPVSLSGRTISRDDGFVQLNHLDQIQFFCSSCYMPHLYYVNMPTKEQVGPLTGQSREALLSYHRNQYQIAHLSHMDAQMEEMMLRKRADR